MPKKVTIKDVAQRAEVSSSAVSMYLNGKPGLSHETRERIRSAIKTLGYVRLRQKARSDGTRPSVAVTVAENIGLLVEKLPFSMLSNLHYGEIIQSMEGRSRDLGYGLSLIIIENAMKQAGAVEASLQALAGVMILGGGAITKEIVDVVSKANVPVLLVDANIPSLEVDSVIVDNVNGAFQAVTYLALQGYQNIACIQGPTKYPSLVERFQGYCAALVANGRQVNEALVQPSISSGFPNKGYREMKALIEKEVPIDAVFCVSDRAALGALEAIHDAQLRIPDDIAVVGFENIPQAAHTFPPLTTVNVPKHAMGEVAVDRLSEMIAGKNYCAPVKTMLYTSLVVRETT